MLGSLRHAQLEVAGAPTVGEALVRQMPLWIGTLLHEEIHRMLRENGVPYMAEVNVTPWLPKGWGGTADGVFFNPHLGTKGAFVLGDFKTAKGEGMRYIARDGAKDEHRYQLSLYWHALRRMGLTLAKQVAVYYLPKNDTRSKDESIEPLLVDFEPVTAKELDSLAKTRFKRLTEYEESLPFEAPSVQIREGGVPPAEVVAPKAKLLDWVTDALEPVQPRVQRLYFDRNTDTHDLKLVPHWSAAFCPFPDELCDCSAHGTTKIGMYDIDGTYYARPGYEEIEPEVSPA